jgi:hypothetical protein
VYKGVTLEINMNQIMRTCQDKSSLGQKLFELLVRSGYLNGKFTCPKKKSLVQIINNLLGQFKLKKKKEKKNGVSLCNKTVYFLSTFTKTNEKPVQSFLE